jgi:hypothetical protein
MNEDSMAKKSEPKTEPTKPAAPIEAAPVATTVELPEVAAPVAPPPALPNPVAAPPTVDEIIASLPDVSHAGYVRTRPNINLTGSQAHIQARLYNALANRGVKLRDQGDVYGWLLDQIAGQGG